MQEGKNLLLFWRLVYSMLNSTQQSRECNMASRMSRSRLGHAWANYILAAGAKHPRCTKFKASTFQNGMHFFSKVALIQMEIKTKE